MNKTNGLIAELLGGKCRYCEKPVTKSDDAAITYSYWQGMPFICHRLCKEAGIRQEAYDCQMIDADCNDCRHFQRGQLTGKEVWSGHCLKFNRETKAYPKKWTGMKCFEHRRS